MTRQNFAVHTTRRGVSAPVSLNPESAFEEITPDLAAHYLEHNNNNRTIKQGLVERYARDMSSGAWHTTHQGIAFYKDGSLADGQHRLWAIVESGVTVVMMVTRGLEPAANEGIDGGAKRTVIDTLHFKGRQVGLLETAIANLLIFSGETYPTRAESVAAYDKHAEAINAVIGMFSSRSKRMRLASVLTPVVRAWYYPQYREKLPRFAAVMIDGLATGLGEEAIILLRNYILFLKGTGGRTVSREIYAKTQRALYAYLHGETLKKNLYAASKELFPLPSKGD